MSIVLNEYEWAESAISHRALGAKPTETLNRISKYYMANHYEKQEIRSMLDNFMVQCNPSVSLVQWSDTLDRIVKNSSKYPLVKLDGVHITSSELELVDSIKGAQLQRLAFALLCVSKYWDSVSATNNHWVNTTDKEIMKMANINTSIKRQSIMFAELRDAGLISFSKKVDNLNVQVLFADDGNPVLDVRDFRNLGYQLLKHRGGAYFECTNCGIVTKLPANSSGRKPKYCTSCALELHTKQRIDSVRKTRTNSSNLVC